VALTEENIFVTLFLAILDTASGHLAYCSAGHPPSFIRRSDGTLDALATESPLVGGAAGLEFVQYDATKGRGDYLFMYTDGAIEARNAVEMFGEERLADVVQGSHSGEDACRAASKAVTEFSGGRLKDDLAILTVSLAP
jgi:serine phosphatase RsbU (regulator of sigma subunit)